MADAKFVAIENVGSRGATSGNRLTGDGAGVAENNR
jgi:glutamate synthase domain-containing protein 1